VAGSLHLPVGEAAIVAVLDELYGYRPEPWLTTLPPAADYAVTPLREVAPIVALPPRADASRFAGGSGEHDSIDDSAPTDPQSMDTEDVVTDRVSFVDPPTPRTPAPVAVVAPAPVPVPVAAPVPVASWGARSRGFSLPTVAVGRPARRAARIATIGVGLAAAAAIAIVAIVAIPGQGKDEPTAGPAEATPIVAPRASPPVAARTPPPETATAAPTLPVPTRAPPAPPTVVTLHVVTDPPGATVVLDGVRLGTAPYTGEVPARDGLAWLKVRKSDRLPVKVHVSLARDVTWTVRLPARPR